MSENEKVDLISTLKEEDQFVEWRSCKEDWSSVSAAVSLQPADAKHKRYDHLTSNQYGRQGSVRSPVVHFPSQGSLDEARPTITTTAMRAGKPVGLKDINIAILLGIL